MTLHLDASCAQLKDDELQRLIVAAQAGDVAARNRVIASTMRLAVRQAHTWARRFGALDLVDDLTQAAVIGHRQERGVGGIMRAVMKYRPERSRWSTYVIYWIDVEISAALTAMLTGLSRRENAKLMAAEALRDRLAHELQRDPTAEEMRADAAERGAHPPDVHLCRRVLVRGVPVDAVLPVTEDEIIEEYDTDQRALAVRREIDAMPAAMGEAVDAKMRGRPLRITCERLGLNRAQVRELEAQGLERLRARFAETR